MKILVVEDDRRVAQSLKLLLSSFNYAADIAEDGETGLQMADAYDYDLILLDVVLPGLDGISVCQQLRTKGMKMPILLLTGQSGGHQKAIALNAGADDYVVKPFDTEELIARLQALLRRGAVTTQPVLTWGSLSIDPSCRQVAYGTRLLSATPKEYAILELFLRNPQNTYSSQAILDHVWRSVESPGEEAVRVHIKELRHKLTAAGAPKDLIKTIHRVGYRLNPVYSSFLADQKEQEMSAAQIAELKSVNEELRVALEELQVAEEELRTQNEELAEAQLTIEQERQRYQDLFEFAPDGYLVTNLRGVIQEANHAAVDLFELEPRFLIGKSLTSFIAKPYIRDFRLRLADLNFIQDWEVYVKPEVGEPFPVVIAVTSIKNQQEEMVGLRWSLRDNCFRREMEQKLQAANDELEMRIAERTAELVTTIQSLQQQQSQWQALFDHALDAIAIADDDGCYVDANPAACELFGVSREELLRSRIADFADPEVDVDPVWQHFLTQGQMSGEFSLYLPDGTIRQTDFRAIANFIPGRHLSVLRDITDRKRLEVEHQAAEIALRESEERYRLLSEISPVGIFRNDLEGRCTYANAKTLEITGLTLEQNLGEGWGQYLHPDDHDWMYAAWSNFVEQVRLGQQAEYQVEHRYLYPDGSLKWMFAQAVPEYNSNNELVGFVGSVIDITDRKQAELALIQNQATICQQLAEIEATYHTAPVGLAILDRDLRYVRVNERLAEINGVSVAEHLGRTVREVVPDLANTAEPRLRHILETGEPFLNFEIAGETAAYPGIHRTWLVNWFPLRANNEQIIGINIVVQEITDRQRSEAALRESERRLSTLMNNLPGYVYRVANDPDYTPEFISEGVFHITGYRQEEYLVDRTATCGQEIHPDDVERVWNLVQQAVEAHQVYECEYRIITKSGTQKWVWERGLGNYDADGNLAFLEGFVTDITDRKQAEETLRANERNYHQILDSIADLVIVKQPDSRFVWVNKAFRDYYGMALEELQGTIDAPFNPPDYTLQYVRDDAFVFTTGQILEIPEEPVTRHDGVVRTFSTIKAPIYDENGQIIMLVAVSRDVTDQKQAEIELRQREEFLRSIYDGAEQAVFVIDLDEAKGFRYVGFNRIAEQFAGMSEQEIYGKNPEEAFGETIGANFRQNYSRCLEAGTNIFYEEYVILKDHTIWTLTTLSPLRNEQGEIYRIIGTAIDITDRKQLELSLQASEIKLSQILDTAIASITSFRVLENGNFEYDYYSAGCEKLFGYSSQEFMTDSMLWLSRLFPEDRETIFPSLFDELFAEQAVTREFRFYHKDGSMRWISSNYAAQKIKDNCWQVTVVDHDITDRKQLEISLQASEAKLSRILDSAIASIVSFRVFDNQEWEYDYYSTGCETLYGYTVQEFTADKHLWISRVFPEDRENVIMPLLEEFLAGRGVPCEFRFYHKDGSIRWISSTHACEKIDDHCWQVIAVNHDITARKQAEAERQQAEIALQKSEEQLRLALELTYIGSWDWYIASGVLIWNSNNYRLLGYQPGEFEPTYQHWRDRIYPSDIADVEQKVATALETQTELAAEYRVVYPDNNIRWVLAKGRGLYDELNQPTRMIGVTFDITDRKQAEFALQQQILREQMVAEISQEIRQSLDLNEVLSRTGERVRELLSTDRVIIFRFRPDWQGDVIMESVGKKWTPILSTTIYDPCFEEKYIEPYRQGRIAAISDVYQADVEPCYVELLEQFQVKANLVVPIIQGETLWGLLIAHHCASPRQWQASEIDLLRQLATHVGIAIQQSELYQQTRLELQKRKRMQAILEESEERFRTINAVAPIGICQTNADGFYLYTNPCWHQMSGLSFEDSLGNGWLQAVHPADRKTIKTAWEGYLQGGSDYLPDFRLLTPQGEIRWVAAKVATMRSATGEVIGYVSIDEDITDRKLAEQKIREQAALLDITSDAILVRDLKHRILYWNRGAERLYGWNATDAIGQVADELLHNDAAQVAEIMQALLHQGEWRGEIHKVTRTGNRVTVEARWTLVRDEASQPKFILSVDTDITEKKQLEAQFYRAQRLESLGTLASGIAHDLNNVLTPILTISQLLRLKQLELDDRSQEMLTVLEDSAKRGAGMVKQILTFTRGTEGDRIPLQIAPVVHEVINVIQQTFPKSITIRENISKQPLSLVSANPTHLHQVLMNLCVNARDAMPNGGVLILSTENCLVDQSVAQKNLDAQVGNYVVITVTDTGSGIPPEIRDRIFEPFFTTKQTGQGTGLGLATVLGIVKNYGGFLQVFSEVEQGTQIKIYLPAITGVSSDISQSEKRFNGNGELVLLVDDDLAVQRGTQALLETHGYTTLVANDGLAAIELYVQRQNEIKLVILDIMMPNMGGIPLIQRLKAIKPTVKIIATSGLSTNREPSLAAGADIFLSKPYLVEALLENIDRLISRNNNVTE